MRARRGLGAGLALAGTLALAACGGGSKSPFDYERSAPLAFHDFGVVNENYPIAIHDVSFASPKGGRARVFLVVPPGKGPFPAVIYAHGSGENRLSMLAQATWFTARGAVALVMDDPFDRDPALRTASDARRRAAIVQEVVDLRRAVDVLQSRPYVDPKRIAFVGFSLGARVGALLAGTEHRIKAFDLESGRGASFGPGLDELAAIRHAHAAFLFQDGLHDRTVPHAQLVALVRAAPQPKEVRWYDAGHGLNDRSIRDGLVWLAHQLGLGGPVVPGAVTGP
ncbi:MAG TPA: dienelactone hydrolase family protein [Gaiellaceae bacterium]|nr:dienelactone hydrolase family protein [Gaiellaceae bacterium]